MGRPLAAAHFFSTRHESAQELGICAKRYHYLQIRHVAPLPTGELYWRWWEESGRQSPRLSLIKARKLWIRN